MTPDIALEYLKTVVKDKLELKHYKRRVELAQEYYDYYTGNLDGRLKRIISRESEIEFEQRCNLTNHVTKAILHSTKLPFQKASRKTPLIRKIDFDSQDSETRRKELNDFIAKYNGDKSLDQYMEQMVIEYNFCDPNAFLITEFHPNDETEKAKPYPFVATSKQIIDYNYVNGIIEYVIVRLDIKYKETDKEYDGYKYTLYNGNETIVFEQVGIDYLENGVEFVNYEDKRRFKILIYRVKAEKDPELTSAAIQFGYIADPETNYETYLGIFDCVLPYLRKTLKNNSELDQAMAMMAFPQRFRYVPSCQNDGCNKGILRNGKTCTVCGGTGKAQVHKGSQDVLELDMPSDPNEMFNLENLSVTKTPPIELLTFLKEYINQLKTEIHTTIFNSDISLKPTIATTATEKLLDTDNMNDTLFAFCRRYSEIWQNVVYFIAVFTDNVKKTSIGSDIIIQHQFPHDLKMKTLADLMADLKVAYDSKASVSTISAIEDDINEILYSDRPDELKKIKTQQLFNPFKGYTPDDIRYIFASGLTTKFNQILYSNYPNIWLDLEKETKPWIYDLEEPKIWELVKGKVDGLLSKIEAEKPKEVMRLDFNTPQNSSIQNNEVSVFYDEQIQLNFRTSNKNISKNNDLLVVPVVLMTEGVHVGSHGAILHKISELGKIPTAWNGIPITINHPKKDGKYVSANMPDIINSSIIGRIYNTKVDNNRLISEAWIERNKLIDLSPDILIDIETGNEIEVSIGAFPEYKNISGEWNGEEYDSIAINYRPDHLAILPDMKGACSTEDGAGINVNGGEGSGNFGHEGRPGEVGGSSDNDHIENTRKEVNGFAQISQQQAMKIANKVKSILSKNLFEVAIIKSKTTDSVYVRVGEKESEANFMIRIADHQGNGFRVAEIQTEKGLSIKKMQSPDFEINNPDLRLISEKYILNAINSHKEYFPASFVSDETLKNNNLDSDSFNSMILSKLHDKTY